MPVPPQPTPSYRIPTIAVGSVQLLPICWATTGTQPGEGGTLIDSSTGTVGLNGAYVDVSTAVITATKYDVSKGQTTLITGTFTARTGLVTVGTNPISGTPVTVSEGQLGLLDYAPSTADVAVSGDFLVILSIYGGGVSLALPWAINAGP